ncbi:MAG: pectate lyase [Prevotella sp.]|nr:pectate lyase [Prevotella sp.]
MKQRMFFSVLAVFMTITMVAAPKPKPQLFVPMDYSTCGYRASERPIPDVKNVLFVDKAADLQRAIDEVSSMKPEKRGAILIAEGTYYLDEPLRIKASGVVLRGMGKGKTILVKRGYDRGAVIYVEGQGEAEKTHFTVDKQREIHQIDDRLIPITDRKVKAGATSFMVKSVKDLKVGSRIRILRPSTWDWICGLKMDDFGGDLDYTGWKPTDIDIVWERTITAIEGNRLTIDAPITCTMTAEQGGGYIINTYNKGEITEIGIENLSLESTKNDWNPKDEDHCWDGIFMENARDCWVRRVDFKHFAGSAVNLQRHTSRITVEDCIASEPVSEIGGWRRQVFLTRGQQCLFQRCVSRQGIHDFAAGYCAAGPNAFVQCDSEESLGFSGSIGSWACGLLFDIVNIDGHDLAFRNMEQFQMGTGWNTANSMFWQCTASTLWCYSPDSLNRNGAHGCWGTMTGNGNWTSSNNHVTPRSLFYHQLEQRTSGQSGHTGINAYLLPVAGEASTSPTVEEAMALAMESLKTPRTTLEMWMDGIPYTAPLSAKGVKRVGDDRRGMIATHPTAPAVKVAEGVLTAGEALVTGNRYAIPWWNGRVKDNFVQTAAQPAITRFVPGREGTGWTDRIDSVAGYLQKNHYAMLDHHYGLWYDLRRTDHERIRRADGDVWAPFYEQPFARSGQGTAWDGLSKYDLTKPNQWYWQRLREFAEKTDGKGIFLFHQHYFQHNILEAGAHWVDCPWRPVNNVNQTSFPEPVPFAGDKRIFMAEQFYKENDPVLWPLHRQYIRMCLDELMDQPNVVHLISAEYTGPLHFTRFWLQTIAEWEQETGRHPLVALSCTKDAQDAILADPILNKVVDIIDIRYWHYNTEGLWAPEAGKNMAPRQWMRKKPVGKTGFEETYRAVREYRDRYPDKAVTFYAQQYPLYGWAVLMAGGSLPNVNIANEELLKDLAVMKPLDGNGCKVLGNERRGYLIYSTGGDASVKLEPGNYAVYTIEEKTGDVKMAMKSIKIDATYTPIRPIEWLRRKL